MPQLRNLNNIWDIDSEENFLEIINKIFYNILCTDVSVETWELGLCLSVSKEKLSLSYYLQTETVRL